MELESERSPYDFEQHLADAENKASAQSTEIARLKRIIHLLVEWDKFHPQEPGVTTELDNIIKFAREALAPRDGEACKEITEEVEGGKRTTTLFPLSAFLSPEKQKEIHEQIKRERDGEGKE